MTIQQKKDLLVNVAFGIFIAAIAYLGIKYLLPITVPFILGFCIAYCIVKLSNRIKQNNSIARIILTFLFYGTIGTVVVLLILKGFTSLYDFVMWIPSVYEHQVAPALQVLYDELSLTIVELDPSLLDTLEIIANRLYSAINDLVGVVSGYAVNFVSSLITSIPSLFLSTLAMIISTFFFVVDYERMFEFINDNAPKKWKEIGDSIKVYLTNTLFVVIRSYIMIMGLTFTELSILFLLFGIKNPFLIAGIIAVFDIMPILGTGGIMIPWGIIALLLGNTVLGIELFVMYGIITAIRNYVEPKIVGAQLGLHPIITLVSMFVGLRLFGFLGMFGFPVGISFLWKKYHVEKMQEKLMSEE